MLSNFLTAKLKKLSRKLESNPGRSARNQCCVGIHSLAVNPLSIGIKYHYPFYAIVQQGSIKKYA